MAEQHDYQALDWIKVELEETLQQARQSLELFVENPEDVTRIRFCMTHLHQVAGTLQMIEFYGAALLAEEMEQLAAGLVDNRVAETEQAVDTLMAGIIQLPSYLERVVDGGQDMAVLILPLLNDMRAARGETLLSETVMFRPDLSAGETASPTDSVAEETLAELPQLLAKVRELFQIALAGVISDQARAENQEYLVKTLTKLEQLYGGTPLAQVWWVASALAEGLRADYIELSTSVRMLLGQLDRLLGECVEQAPQRNVPLPQELLKNLLYYVARSEHNTEQMLAVRAAFQLEGALPVEPVASGQTGGADPAVVASALKVMLDELAEVKETLEALEAERASELELEAVMTRLKQVSDTLAIMSLGNPRRVIQEQIEGLQRIVHGEPDVAEGDIGAGEEEPVPVPTLMDIAGGLLYVEATLGGMIQGSSTDAEADMVPAEQLSNARMAVIHECRVGLESVKEAITEYAGHDFNPFQLNAVPELMASIRGGLMMVPLSHPAVLLQSCQEFIEQELMTSEEPPAFDQLTTLADAISGIDYYLERFDQRLPDKQSILDIAHEAVVALGFPPQPHKLGEDEVEADGQAAVARIRAAYHATTDAALNDVVLNEGEGDLKFETADAEDAPEETVFEFDGADEHDEFIAAEAVPAELESAEPATESEAASEEAAAAGEAEVLPIEEPEDDEILEIFVEEAGEVLETINQYLPAWAANPEPGEAQTEIRRAYHTLKGSGRMVGANTIGELAWSIESLLNRIIDGQVGVTPEVTAVIERVTAEIPAMVTAFEQRQRPQAPVSALQAVADALARGETPPPLPGLAATPAEAEMAAPAIADTAIAEIDSAETEPEEIDTTLFEIFSQEASGHLETIKGFLLDYEATQFSDAALRAMHTLKGSAHMAEITKIAEVAAPVERFFKECHIQGVPVDKDLRLLMEDYVQVIETGLETLRQNPESDLFGATELLESVERLRVEKLVHAEAAREAEPATDATLQAFLSDAMEILSVAGDSLRHWEQQLDAGPQLEQLCTVMGQLARHASAVQQHEVVALGMTLQEFYNAANQNMITPDSDYFSLAHRAHEQLITMVDALAGDQPAPSADAIVDELQQLMDNAPEVLAQLAQATDDAAADATSADSATEDDFHFEFSEDAADSETHAEFDAEFNAMEAAVSAEESSRGEDDATVPEFEDDTSEFEFAFADTEFDDPDFDGEDELAAAELPEELMVTDLDDEPEVADVESVSDAETAAPVVAAASASDSSSDDDIDDELVEIFLEEASEILDSTSEELESWIQTPEDMDLVVGLQRSLHTLKGGARMSNMPAIGDLSHHLENLYEGLSLGHLQAKPLLFGLLRECHDRLAQMYTDIESRQPITQGEDLIARIADYVAGREDAAAAATVPAASTDVAEDGVTEEAVPEEEAVVADQTHVAEIAEGPAPTADGMALSALSAQGEQIDTEILEIFLEEAEELAEGIDNTISEWLGERDSKAHLHEMQRLLHTLKGGARLAGLKQIGDLSHDFETFLINSEMDRTPLDDVFFARVQQDHDALISHMEHLRQHGSELLTAGEQQAQQEPAAADEATTSAPQVAAETRPKTPAKPPIEAEVVPITEQPRPEVYRRQGPLAAIPNSGMQTESSQRGNSESVKVSAELMENLVNLAGETSILRGRVEQEIADFNFVIDDIGTTVERARELLRRLDIETEAQILHRYQQAQTEGKEYEEFDPLEMDRYSTLNQLSRSLGETVSDMNDLKDSLINRARDAETLLMQQSRINSELQESLMRTRMVPFSRTTPRLRRIVRQVAGELDKKAELEIIGADGEMDRTVLERMVAPLEHMLRNAVDHGLETPAERAEKGKPETGRITIHLAREGGEVVLRLSDDGKGVNLERVKQRAIERGLMKANSPLSDSEIMQFIFKQGFSTAEKVTQISGRGVGMDVVHTEIKQLGGSVRLHSAANGGSQFTIRLPFTVSVNRALMVRVGDDLYAVPLNNIEGIVRMSPYELDAYYQPDAPAFEYAGQSYDVRYLGRYVHNNPTPNLTSQTRPLPVLLVRSAERAVALQVDSLLGSKEVVVKSVGPQLAAVSGISGATILGDGSVVIIIDVNAVIRAEQAQLDADAQVGEQQQPDLAGFTNETPTIMVVDDSVTVRKVTGRLLERNGYEVVTAKDGVDAITQLQDIRPDVMLLDIEMPRMDGFEVATLVRHDDRLRATPIIMITSRTGDKHRDRAMSIGVNRYMGKPYQESELLEAIEALMQQQRRGVREQIH